MAPPGGRLSVSAVDPAAVAPVTPEAADVLDSAQAGRLVVRGGALRGAGFAAGTLLSVLGAAVLTRHLGPRDYGRYQSVVGLVAIVQVMTDVGLATLGTREFAQRRGADRVEFVRLLLGLRMVLTGLGVGLAALAALALGDDGQMVAGAALAGLGLLVVVIQGTLAIPLNVELRMGAVTALDVLRQALVVALTVGLVAAGAGIVPFLAMTIPVHLVLLVLTARLVRDGVPRRPSFDRRRWAALLRPTLTFSLATAVGVIYVYTALLLTGLVTSAAQTGQFAAAFRVYVILAAVPGVLVTTAFPVLARAARDDRARLASAVQRLAEGAALLGGATGLGTIVGAPAIVEVVAGPRYHDAIAVLRIDGVALLLTFVIAPWGFTMLADHRQRPLLAANLLAFATSALTVLVLARGHGAQGAAWGTLLGECVLAAAYYVALAQGERALRPGTRRALRVIPAFGVGLLPLATGLPSVPATALSLGLYAGAALVLRAVPTEALALLSRRGR